MKNALSRAFLALISCLSLVLGNAQSLNGQTFYIQCKQSGKYLDVAGYSMANGGNIHQWDFHGGANQQFTFYTWTSDSYYIMSKQSNRVIDVAGVDARDGANIQQWEFVRGDNQTFKLIPAGNGYYFIQARHSGKYLDVAAYSRETGGNIHQWTYHGGDNQQFKLIPVNGGQSTAPATSQASNSSCHFAIGHWKWFNGTFISLKEDGSITQFKGPALGKWQCVDTGSRKIKMIWNNGYTDIVNVSADTNAINGVNNKNEAVSGVKMSKSERDAASMQKDIGNAMNKLFKKN